MAYIPGLKTAPQYLKTAIYGMLFDKKEHVTVVRPCKTMRKIDQLDDAVDHGVTNGQQRIQGTQAN